MCQIEIARIPLFDALSIAIKTTLQTTLNHVAMETSYLSNDIVKQRQSGRQIACRGDDLTGIGRLASQQESLNKKGGGSCEMSGDIP